MDDKRVKMVEMVLSSCVLTCKWRLIVERTFRTWFCAMYPPNPILDLLFFITYFGYVGIFVLIVTSAISFKTPTGKYARFFTGMALFLHIFCQIFLFQDLNNAAEIISIMFFLALIIILGLDISNQI